MKKTIIVLIALAVALIFYWQFFVPQGSAQLLKQTTTGTTGGY